MLGKPSHWILATLIAVGILMAQIQEDPRRLSQYRVSVNVVTVDVIVTDKQGACPSDLRAEDFEIYENGVRQEIQDFQWIQTEFPTGGAAPPMSPAAGKPGDKTLPQQSPPEAPASPRLFLLAIDNLNSRWSNLAQTQAAVETLISKRLRPQDLAAVIAVSHARLMQNFTTDRESLLAATQRAFRGAVQGTGEANEVAQAIEDMQELMRAAEREPALQDMAERARYAAAQLLSIQSDYSARNALITVQALCRALAGLKGRKAIVLISEGFGPSAAAQLSLNSVVDAAARANVSIYPINPRGLEIVNQPPLQLRKNSWDPWGTAPTVVAGNSNFDLIRLERFADGKDDGLSELAAGTGGLVFRNSNDFLKGLENVVRDSHTYYELTYVPKNQTADGSFRRIEVRLAANRKGYTLRARRGYYAVDSLAGFRGTAAEQMSQALFSPELLDQLHTSIAPALFMDPRGENIARVALRIDPADMPLKKSGDRYTVSFGLLAAVFDENGTIVRDYGKNYRLSLDEATHQTFLREGTSLAMTFQLPPGKHEVKIVLRELDTGKMSTRRERLEAIPLSRGLPHISSIVLSRSVVPYGGAKDVGESYDPLRTGNVLIVPSLTGTYPPEGALTVFFHVYNVSDSADKGGTPYQCQLNLYRDEVLYSSSDARAVQGENRHPLRGYLLTSRIHLSNLLPGRYRLEVVVALPDGRNSVSRSVPFQVQ